jgi:hypothetical protein
MEVYGFKDRQDVLDVKARNLRERNAAVENRAALDMPITQFSRNRTCWVTPKGTIPARTDERTPGRGTAYLCWLNIDEDPPTIQRWTYGGEETEILVSNYLDQSLVEDTEDEDGLTPLLRADQDVFGEIAIFQTGGGGPGFVDCGDGGLMIPGLEDAPIGDGEDTDFFVTIRDGCWFLVPPEECEKESGSGSGSASESIEEPLEPEDPEPPPIEEEG